MLLLAAGVFSLVAFFVGHNVSVLVVAILFALAGVQLVAGRKGRGSALMGSLVCIGLSGLGLSVAFGHGPIEGGIPLIPDAWNQKIGRSLFGGGACLTALMALYFLRQAWKPGGKRDSAA